ncbi:MAG: endonuclease III [Planctomycetota bacterium]|nr:MAG: endonuclease III [Planctomycetota bacterium]
MPRESVANRKKRAGQITEALKQLYPQAGCSLNHANPLELLVATILSAQCTDERVNVVTKSLFEKYRTTRDYAQAPQEQFEEDIRSTGFYRNKTRNIRQASALLLEKFAGQVPQTMDELLTLPGVARKTANVILATAFGKCEGVVVDTHVIRLCDRLKLIDPKNRKKPEKIERDLMKLLPPSQWTIFSHLLIFHGRSLCTARKPNCQDCPLAPKNLCPAAKETLAK